MATGDVRRHPPAADRPRNDFPILADQNAWPVAGRMT